jgi:hypothetical protein
MTEKESAPPAEGTANVTPLPIRRDPANAEGQPKFRRKFRGQPPPRRGAGVTPAAAPGPALRAPAVRTAVAAPAAPSPVADPPLRVSFERPPAVTAAMAIGTDMAAYLAVIALAGAAAFFSIKGMIVLFPGAPAAVVGMALAMESAKLVTAGWLAHRWRDMAWAWRCILFALVTGLAVINGVGVFSQLVAAHVGERGAAAASIEMQDAALTARIDVQAHAVADLDRRLSQIDTAIEEQARHGRTSVALSAIDGHRKTRQALADDRQREAWTLSNLKAERAALGARGRQLETDAAPIRYAAEMLGSDTDSERAIRWLIVLMVVTCDPLAIALTAAVSARKCAG